MKTINYLLFAVALLLSGAFMPAQALVNESNEPMTQSIAAKLDINTATAEQLTALPGVGIKKAEQIVKYRELNGNFNSVDELVNVKGIGVKMVGKFIDLVKI